MAVVIKKVLKVDSISLFEALSEMGKRISALLKEHVWLGHPRFLKISFYFSYVPVYIGYTVLFNLSGKCEKCRASQLSVDTQKAVIIK